MTGFGSEILANDTHSVKVEARAVNHRYLDVSLRLPKGYYVLEEKIRRLAGEHASRGRLEILLAIEEYRGKDRTVRLDRALLEGYQKAFAEAQGLLRQEIVLTADMLLGLPDVLVVEESEGDPETVWPLVKETVQRALEKLHEMRRIEGARLERDILGHIGRFSEIVGEIAALAPKAAIRYRERLFAQVQEALETAPVDEQRIAQEIAIFADKSNIDEEISRARSHIDQFMHACRDEGSVGRKLDFLVQEMNREVNTIASKAQDAAIAALVVEAKTELEKIREQVQNVQ